MANKKRRTFNYLGRADIELSMFDITAMADAGKVVLAIDKLDIFDGSIFGHDAELWNAAHVWIESWRNASTDWHRINIGTVVQMRRIVRDQQRFELPNFAAADGIHFTIKVVDHATGRLLARGFSARTPIGQVDDLLDLRVEPSLGETPWRLSWPADNASGPTLLVSAKLACPQAIIIADVRSKASTLPQVVREIMLYLAYEPQARDEQWGKDWINFCKADPSAIPESPSWNEAIDWAESCVDMFCQEMKWVSAVNKLDEAS